MGIRRDKYLDLLIHSCGYGLIKVIAGTLRNSAFQKNTSVRDNRVSYTI